MAEQLTCETCGEPIRLTQLGLLGIGGVCRNPFNPNQDDEGLHLVMRSTGIPAGPGELED